MTHSGSIPPRSACAVHALGDLELGVGRLEAAIEHLGERERLLADLQIADRDISAAPELVEVCVRAGRIREAERVARGYLAAAQEKGQPWALARAGRCRGLLADANAFDEPFARAFDQHELTPDAYELARTQLCYGERLRRARRRTDARVQLRAAFSAFGELGAVPWAERARLELQATGETARRRRPSTLDQLTPQELRIALALADGKTMRAAAAELFLSPKTIEYHLRNAYRKLGIRSRAELLRALDADPVASHRDAAARRGVSRARRGADGGGPDQRARIRDRLRGLRGPRRTGATAAADLADRSQPALEPAGARSCALVPCRHL
jgi:DNA-binding CsgD family transcriptional regulator